MTIDELKQRLKNANERSLQEAHSVLEHVKRESVAQQAAILCMRAAAIYTEIRYNTETLLALETKGVEALKDTRSTIAHYTLLELCREHKDPANTLTCNKLVEAEVHVDAPLPLPLPLQSNLTVDHCPRCGAPEIPYNGPQTMYDCGSSDYDQRPNTFVQSEECFKRTRQPKV